MTYRLVLAGLVVFAGCSRTSNLALVRSDRSGAAGAHGRNANPLMRIVVLAAVLALLLGCGPSPEGKIDLARRTVRSWTATVRKTTEALQRDAVPALYGRQVFEAAVQSREEESGKPEWRALPAEDRAALDHAIGRLASLLGQPTAIANP
jgi:hypothetical protein